MKKYKINIRERARAAVAYHNSKYRKDENVELESFMAIFHPEKNLI